MTLALPNLDDRTYDDLVQEARELLVSHAPSLTNHNPSDPLITLTELFAYLTEILVYRTNLVTNDNRIAFLRLLNGPQWQVPPPEALDEEVRATVRRMRTIDRAVTPADFEQLAMRADSRVARAVCVPDADLTSSATDTRFDPRQGHVSVVIVPTVGVDVAPLLPLVTSFLEPRRLLGTYVHVVAAPQVPIGVAFTLHLLPDAVGSVVRQRAIETLAAYFDPLSGGDGTGWLGRDVYVSDLYRLLDTVPGVDFVSPARNPASGAAIPEIVTDTAHENRRIVSVGTAPLGLIGIALRPGERVLLNSAADAFALEQPSFTSTP